MRVRYARRGRLRFSSHRDFQRALERAIRRASIPIAFSAGFSPHPRVSYTNAAPTGAASEAEYLELGLSKPCAPSELGRALNEALPDGLDVVDTVIARSSDFPSRLEASLWRIELPDAEEARVLAVRDAFWDASSIMVQRRTKSGTREFDAREPVEKIDVVETSESSCVILNVVVRHVTLSVRPDDVLEAFRQVANFEPPVSPRVTRLAQGPLDPVSGVVGDPLAPDREAESDDVRP